MGRFDYMDLRGTHLDPAEYDEKDHIPHCRGCGEIEDCCTCEVHDDFGEIESHSGGNPGEKSEGLHSDHRGIPQARSSEGGNVGELPGVSIQSREPVDSNTVSVGRPSPEPRYATDVDAAPSSRMPSDTDEGERA